MEADGFLQQRGGVMLIRDPLRTFARLERTVEVIAARHAAASRAGVAAAGAAISEDLGHPWAVIVVTNSTGSPAR